MRTEHTLQPEIRDIPMDALGDQPATPANWINALHLTYREIQALRIAIDDVASLLGSSRHLGFLPSSADWVQESLTVANNILTRALDIEHTAISSAMKIHNQYSCSVNDAIAPFIKITETALIISISAFTQVNNFSYLPDDDKAALVTVDRFVNIAKAATCIAETACTDIAALRKGVTRERWLAHLDSLTAGHFLR